MEHTEKNFFGELKDILTALPPAEEKQLKEFAWIMSGALTIIGVWPVLFRQEALRLWCLPAVALFLLFSILAPKALMKPYQAWMVLGGLLGHLNAKIILTVLFFVILTPIAIILRWLNRDIIAQKFDPKTNTYRTFAAKKNSPAQEQLRRQF